MPGTPQLATDSSQAVAWQATYQPLGTASVSGTVTQNLRFPGAGGPGATPFVPPRSWLPQMPRFWASGRARHSPGLLLVPQMLRQLSSTARIERWRSLGTRSKQPRIPHSVRDDNGFPGFWSYDRLTGKRAEQPQMFRLRFAQHDKATLLAVVGAAAHRSVWNAATTSRRLRCRSRRCRCWCCGACICGRCGRAGWGRWRAGRRRVRGRRDRG